MTNKIIKIIMLVIMISNGLLFVINIYVLGDREAAIEMHEDLSPDASALMANLKVLVGFATGILYLIGAYGIIRKKYALTFAGIMGFVLFDGFYIIELVLWAASYPLIWISFGIFGSLAFIIGAYSHRIWRKRKA